MQLVSDIYVRGAEYGSWLVKETFHEQVMCTRGPLNGTELQVILKNEKGKQSFLAMPIKKNILHQDPPYSLVL